MDTDLQLVAQAINAGKPDAFAQLVERHQSRIRQFLRRLTAGDWHSADDLAQDTFVLAYRKIHSFKATGTFSAWLHTIAWRQFLSWQRTRVKRAEVSMLEDASFDPRTTLDAEMTAQRVMQVLNADERVSITLSYAEGMSHAEISAITGMALGTVKSHIYRAMQKMKQWVEDYDHSVSTAPRASASEDVHDVG